MYIKEIYIDNFGKLTSTTFGFDNSINTIKTMHGAELTDALELVLGNKTDSRFLNSKTIIKATVNIEKTYYVEIKSKKLQAFDENGTNCTEDYLHLISNHKEENDASCFKNFRSKNFPHKLLKYKNTEKYYSGNEFATVTGGFGGTKTFRSYLNSYIKNFEPLPLINGKENFLTLDETGEFDVLRNNDNDIPLSESESMVYHFMSFIHLAKFWADIEKMRDMNHPLKPLIMPLFLEMLDENIDVSAFISLAVGCERQAIFIDR